MCAILRIKTKLESVSSSVRFSFFVCYCRGNLRSTLFLLDSQRKLDEVVRINSQSLPNLSVAQGHRRKFTN